MLAQATVNPRVLQRRALIQQRRAQRLNRAAPTPATPVAPTAPGVPFDNPIRNAPHAPGALHG
jgi:hypothetical protein